MALVNSRFAICVMMAFNNVLTLDGSDYLCRGITNIRQIIKGNQKIPPS